ncbi:MAG: class I SAM-dependent methyltransferase [Candidatus Helarchaeales archaeon]
MAELQVEHKKEIKNKYDETAQVYDKRYREIQWQKFALIFKEDPINPREMIADLGCGTGLLFEYLKIIPRTSIVVDLSIEMLKILKGKFHHPSIHPIMADIEHLPLKSSIFDRAFLITSLQNVPDRKNVLSETHRVVSSGGNIILSVLKKKYERKDAEMLMHQFKCNLIKRFNLEKLEDIVEILRKTK